MTIWTPVQCHLMNHGQMSGPHQAECHGTDLPSSAVIDFGQHITQPVSSVARAFPASFTAPHLSIT